jgi:SsrA-binding protein
VAGKDAKPRDKTVEKPIARNSKATVRYDIEEKLEVGIVLKGSEVKSLRMGRCDLEGSFAFFENDELFLKNAFIAPYEQAGVFGHEPKRNRKLLLHAREIEKWRGRITMRGYSMVPIRMYFKGSKVKVEIGLGRGKKHADDREKIKREVDMKEARAAMNVGRKR